MSTRDRRDLPERLRDIASTLERHGWLRDKGERPVYWVEKAADEITRLERERDGFQKRVVQLEQRYRHYHEAGYENGVLTDRCLQCGEDLRSNIHSRAALRSPEDK